ncbi:MAG: ParB/RepB/Spo0J family partition protein [Planctomycetes bacterium]|nr:ParB/RepB/Spo0J family partition protein [Planctomycetota bacterium]
MEKRLGRGLGALLGASAAVEEQKGPQRIPLERIRPNPYQPRRNFGPEALEELTSSIRQHGVLQPIAVRPSQEGFEIIAGERRVRASKLAGLTSIPAVLHDGISDRQMLELALVENVQRQDLDAIERAIGFQRMQRELELTQEEVADRVGLKRSTVANHLRLLELSPVVQEAIAKGLITMGHAKALLGLEKPGERERWLSRIVRDELSVRQVEQLVRVAPKAVPASLPRGDGGGTGAAWITALEQRLRESTGTKVEIRNAPGFSGQIVLSYFGRQELERIIDQLAPKSELR